MDSNCNTDCEYLGSVTEGTKFVAAAPSPENCQSVLIENANNKPAVLLAESATSTEQKDGGLGSLIETPSMQSADAIRRLLIASGEKADIKGYIPLQALGTSRVISRGRSFMLGSNTFPGLIQDNQIEEVLGADWVLGGNDIQAICGSTATSINLGLIPTGFEFPAIAAVNDSATLDVETPEVIAVKTNDTFTGTVTIEIVTEPTHGTAEVEVDGTITYIPDEFYCGSDSFTYRILDAYGQISNTATVSLTVTCPAIAAVADSVDADYETAVNFDPKSNDTGVGIAITSVIQPANGTVVIELDNTLTYTPDPGFDGADPFIYTITDDYGQIRSVAVTVTVSVTEPTCYAGSVQYRYDASLLTGIEGSSVAAWADTSGNSRNASQATGGFQPVLRLANRNGLNVVEFDGTDDVLATSAFSVTALTNSTLFAIFKPDTAGGAVFARKANSAGAAGEKIEIATSATEINAQAGVVRSTVSYADGANWLLVKITGDFDGVSRAFEMTVNGVLVDSAGSYDTGTPGSQIMRLGCRNHGFGNEVFFDGLIGEIICISDYDPTCEANWEDFLKTKWGFTY
jgi:hypothetical protein